MSLQAKTWKNLGLVGGLQAFSALLQTGTNILLARILFPEDFGIIALAQTFVLFVHRFQDFGLGTAIVQKDGEVEDLLYTANAFRAIVSVALVLVCWLVGPGWASFYGEPAIGKVIRILAITFLLNSFVFIPRSLMRREMQFKAIVGAESGGAVVNSVTKIVMALSGFGFWCIPAGALAGQATAVVLYHVLRPHPFKLMIKKAAAQELYTFARFLVISGIVTFVNTNLDRMTVGKMLGLASLGFFDIAYRWGTWLTQQLARILPRVLLPTLSRIQDDLPRLSRGVLRATETLTAATAPCFLGLSAVAPDFIVTLLGERWSPSATALRIAAFCGLFRSQMELPRNLLISVGLVRWPAIGAAAVLVVTVVAIVPLTILHGIEGAAFAIAAAALAGWFTMARAMIRKLEIPAGAYLGSILPSLAAAAAMAVVVYFACRALPGWAPAARLLAGAGIGAAAYSVLLCLFTRRGPRAWLAHLRPWRTPSEDAR